MELEDKKMSWWQRSVLRFLKLGPVPKHIGFIMDGNRRFARNSNLVTIQGHEMGYNIFANTISLGLEIGIKEITTYALSIENLNRPKDELDGLWNLMDEKFSAILNRIDEFLKKRVVITFIGNLSLMPKKLQKLCSRIVDHMGQIEVPVMTCYLAICYTSRDEITTSMKKILCEVNSGGLKVSDINDELVRKCLYRSNYPVDMIVRTSGETRLSDFLLWQCSDAVLYFTDVLWPEFDKWEMIKSVMYYQYCRLKDTADHNQGHTEQQMDPHNSEEELETRRRIDSFVKLDELREMKMYKSFSQIQV